MIAAARYLYTPPWELENAALCWFQFVNLMQFAEARAKGATYTVQEF